MSYHFYIKKNKTVDYNALLSTLNRPNEIMMSLGYRSNKTEEKGEKKEQKIAERKWWEFWK